MADDERARNRLGEPLQLTEETARRLISALDHTVERTPMRHVRRNQVLSAVVGTVGFALFIVGVERAAQDIPIISNAWGSIAVGLVLLGVTGAMLARLRGRE
jgi:hypothetical protein